jgi:hypothetical protein
LQNGIVVEEWIARKVHLGNKPRDEGRPKQRKVDVRRAPCIVVITPRIGARFNGHKTVESVVVGQSSSRAGEVRIERGGVVVFRVRVSSRRIRLPNLDQAVRHGVAIPIHYSPAHNDALPQRFPRLLNRKVSIIWMNVGIAKDRACDLRQSVRQEDQRLRWRPQSRRAVRRVQIVRLGACFMSAEWGDRYSWVALVLDRRRVHVDVTVTIDLVHNWKRPLPRCYKLQCMPEFILLRDESARTRLYAAGLDLLLLAEVGPPITIESVSGTVEVERQIRVETLDRFDF